MNRGIVSPPTILNSSSNGFHMKRGLTIDELKYYTLYFDKLVIPDNNMISIGVANEEELINLNILDRPRYTTSSLSSNNYIEFQSIIVMDELNKLQKEDSSCIWTYHQIGGSSLCIPSKFMEKKETLKINLINQLPVPSENISFEDILSFKDFRKDELKKLHDSIDKLYLDILNSPDLEFSRRKTFHELSKDLSNIKKVSKEKWNFTSNFNLNYEFSLKDFIQNLGAGILLDKTLGTYPIASVLGATISAIDIKLSSNLTIKDKNQNNQLSFLSSAYKENIINLK